LDSLTQIVLGASVAEAVAGKKLGNKAPLWGAIAGTIPDLDVFLRFLYHPIEASLVHRGFSHSLLFALLISPLLAYVVSKLYRGRYEYKLWLWLFFLAVVTHPILDMFTNYGTQFLWPLSNRISFNTIFVMDPLYTFPFAMCILICLFLKRESIWRKRINLTGISYSTLYLIWGISVKLVILANAPQYLKKSGIPETDRIIVKPMPFTSFYWNILAENKETYILGYKSIFYPFNTDDVQYLSKKDHIPLNELRWKGASYSKELSVLSNDFGYACQSDSNIYFYDLRFGVSTMLTNKKNTNPVFGFTMETDSHNRIIHTEPYRPREVWKDLNFNAYLNKVFYE